MLKSFQNYRLKHKHLCDQAGHYVSCFMQDSLKRVSQSMRFVLIVLYHLVKVIYQEAIVMVDSHAVKPVICCRVVPPPGALKSALESL